MSDATLGPALLLHGMCCTGAIWSGFRRPLEARGWQVSAPTLRPDWRVPSGAPRALDRLGLDDYADDLAAEISGIAESTGRMPVLIGHSMGALLAQMLAARGLGRAAVLLASAPTAGVGAFSATAVWTLREFLFRPASRRRPFRFGRRAARFGLFHRLEPADREAAYDELVCESSRAIRDMTERRVKIDPQSISIPTLSVGAERDRLVPARLAAQIAARYAGSGGRHAELPGLGHWLIREPGWERVAALCDEFLQQATAGKREEQRC